MVRAVPRLTLVSPGPLWSQLLSWEVWAGPSLLWACPLPRTPCVGTFQDSMTCAGGSCWSPDPQWSSQGLFEVGAPRSRGPPWPWLQLREESGGSSYAASSRRPPGLLPSQPDRSETRPWRAGAEGVWGRLSFRGGVGPGSWWFGLGTEGTLLPQGHIVTRNAVSRGRTGSSGLSELLVFCTVAENLDFDANSWDV